MDKDMEKDMGKDMVTDTDMDKDKDTDIETAWNWNTFATYPFGAIVPVAPYGLLGTHPNASFDGL
jgi:hypothetical protein